MSHKDDQEFERKWWGTCQNTYGEETKQLVYARLMGLVNSHDGNSPYSFDVGGKSILDIGGGPSSLLLKCRNLGFGAVVDPCAYPPWVHQRYAEARVAFIYMSGESFVAKERLAWFDEVWIYNVLQHTEDPEQIIRNAKSTAPALRIFEWIDIPPHEGHPHMLTEAMLNKWIDGIGTTGVLNGEGMCYGRYYSGAFIRRSHA